MVRAVPGIGLSWELRGWEWESGVDMTTKMRPFKGTISLDEARAIIDAPSRRSTRVERVPLEHANGRVLARDRHLERRRSAVRARRDGRLRRPRRRTPPAPAARRRERCAASRKCSPDRCRCRRSAPGQCIEIATGAPMPAGADAVVMVEETDSDERRSSRVRAGQRRGRTSAGRARTSRKASTSCSRARCSTRAASGRWRRSGCTDVDGVRQAARGDSLDRQRDRRTGAAARAGPDLRHQPLHRSPPSSPTTAACRSPIASPTTRSKICRARSTSVSSRTCWSSRAAAPSASAI